ncbi:MAG: HAMP domain-containing histidine kinase [Cyclobacteriaceae bacterium]
MFIKNWFRQIIQFGTKNEKNEDLRKDIILINISCMFGAVVCLLTALISYESANISYRILNLITGLTCLVPIAANYYHLNFISKSIVVWVIPALMLTYIYLFGNMGADNYIIVGMVVGIYFFRQDKWGIFMSVTISGICYVASKIYLWNVGLISLDGIGEYLYFPNLFLCLIAIGWLTERFRSYYVVQNGRIKRLHESRGKLISVLSHDLRSPLNNLQHLLDELRNDSNDQERQDFLMGMISDSLKNTTLLLDNATYWINSEGDQFKSKSRKLLLNDLIDENVKLYEPMALHKGLVIESIQEDEYWIDGDRNIIKMILRNLLSNAIKFTPQNGEHIQVIIGMKEGKTWIGVKDQGRGMEPEEIDFLLSDKRQSTPGTSDEGGTGMGLTLIKYFLNLIGSELKLESAKNEGTFICFSLNPTQESN